MKHWFEKFLETMVLIKIWTNSVKGISLIANIMCNICQNIRMCHFEPTFKGLLFSAMSCLVPVFFSLTLTISWLILWCHVKVKWIKWKSITKKYSGYNLDLDKIYYGDITEREKIHSDRALFLSARLICTFFFFRKMRNYDLGEILRTVQKQKYMMIL